jgi:hypothetical protein
MMSDNPYQYIVEDDQEDQSHRRSSSDEHVCRIRVELIDLKIWKFLLWQHV